jgi:hypothetical protein
VVEKQGRRAIDAGSGAAAPAWTVLRLFVALVLVVSGIGADAPPFLRGFILSPSATLRGAGLAPRVKVEHPTV